jgi:hypothetical protein
MCVPPGTVIFADAAAGFAAADSLPGAAVPLSLAGATSGEVAGEVFAVPLSFLFAAAASPTGGAAFGSGAAAGAEFSAGAAGFCVCG